MEHQRNVTCERYDEHFDELGVRRPYFNNNGYRPETDRRAYSCCVFLQFFFFRGEIKKTREHMYVRGLLILLVRRTRVRFGEQFAEMLRSYANADATLEMDRILNN